MNWTTVKNIFLYNYCTYFNESLVHSLDYLVGKLPSVSQKKKLNGKIVVFNNNKNYYQLE